MEMELSLARLDAQQQQVTVTCNETLSHTFDLHSLNPGKATGLPYPINDPITYGKALYTALFPLDSLAAEVLARKPSRIVLVAADDSLDVLPWEYASGPDGWLVCRCSLVRGLPKEQRSAPPSMLGGLHLIAVASNPLDHTLAPLNIQGEWTRLTEMGSDLDRAVTLERAWPPTILRLRDLVAGQQQRVIHFMGHGGQNKQGEAVLCFECDDGTREDIFAREFVQRVQGGVFLVTLNACESAAAGETLFANLARALVREQVPYALGMRFVVHDDDALAFSRDFYRNLARGVPVEDALLQARLTLARSARAWACGNLVLYTSLTQAAPGYMTEPGEPDVRDPQERALRGIIGILPEVQGAFQGRIDERIQLGRWLTGDRRPRIITIHGSGGQGKTALARVAVERIAHAWPAGVWSMGLETVPTRAVFATSLARFLGIPPQDGGEQADLERQIQHRLRQRRALLVLDNLETLEEAAKAQDAEALSLIEFIQQLPGERTSLLTTSRHLLGWPGEQRLELPGLTPKEGASLFEQSAPARLKEIDHSLAQKLSQRVDGHPLGLFLLGRAFNDSHIALSAFLADHETYLLSAENRYTGVDDRQRTMLANIAYSVRWLSDDLRETLSKLWVFHASFLPATAVSILDPEHDATSGEASPIEQHLYILWQRGLLIREAMAADDEGVYFYRLPPVMRPYIERSLADEQGREEMLRRFGTAYARLATYIYLAFARGRGIAGLALQCYDDLARGLSLVEGSQQSYYLLHWGMILHWLGDRHRAVFMTEKALELAEGYNRALEGEAKHNLAMMSHATGRSHQALRLFEQALQIHREVGNRTMEGNTLNSLGLVYHDLRQQQQALDYCEQALLISKEVGNRAVAGTTLNNMGLVYDTLGQKQQALNYYEQALQIHREVGIRTIEGITLNNMGLVYDTLGQKQQALNYYEQAILISRKMGDRASEGNILNNMGGVYHDLGQKQQALDCYDQALLLLREVGDRAKEVATLNSLGLFYEDFGQKQQALDYYKQAVQISKEMGDRAGEFFLLNKLGLVSNALEQKQQALDYYKQAVQISREMRDQTREATTLHNIGILYAGFGQSDVALACFLLAKAFYEDVHRPSDINDEVQGIAELRRRLGEEQFALLFAQVEHQTNEIAESALQAKTLFERAVMFTLAAEIYQSRGQSQEALLICEQALPILRGVGDRAEEATTLTLMARVCQSQGRSQEALRLYEQILSIRREVGDRAGEGTTLNNLGSIYDDLGQKQHALDYYQQALLILREVGDRSGEGITLHNISMIYAQFGQFDVALAGALLAKALFEYVQSPYVENEAQWIAALRTRLGEQQFAALFAQVEPQANNIVERALQEKTLPDDGDLPPSTLPTERITVIAHNTIAVITIVPERLAEWRETMAGALANAQQRGIDWQIEVDFFTAILAILDGLTGSLPADHPYAAPITAIQEGISRGGPIPENEDDVSEAKQTQIDVVEMSVAALQSKNPQEKMAFLQQIATLQAQASDDEMKALFQALQLALLGGDLAHLGDTLTGQARHVWETIVAGMRQDNIPPDDPSNPAE